MDWIRVGAKKDFEKEGAFGVQAGGVDVCVVNLGGKFYALDDRCTHADSLLSPGEAEDGELACPLHGARFNLQTGEAVTPPATVGVRVHQVKVDGDDVFVLLSDAPASA